MRIDPQTVAQAQRRAYKALADQWIIVAGAHVKDHNDKSATQQEMDGKTHWCIPNPFHVDPKLITAPTEIIQELAWQGQSQMIFDFSLNGPAHVAGIDNNIQITAGSFFAFYGIKLYFGNSTNNVTIVNTGGQTVPYSSTTQYWTNSPTNVSGDEALYNSYIQFKVESNTLIDKLEGQQFKEINPFNPGPNQYNEQGLVLVNPVRIVKGIAGIQQIIWNAKQQAINPATQLALPISPATIVSCRLVGVWGQKNG